VADETLRGVELAHRYADLADVRLHYVEAGEGPLVLLLHGFPQFWYQWRHQIPALVEAGFRVVAPDMRGYNLSDKPLGVRAYRVELLARDVERLILACGGKGTSSPTGVAPEFSLLDRGLVEAEILHQGSMTDSWKAAG
jgi:hypothetical protein